MEKGTCNGSVDWLKKWPSRWSSPETEEIQRYIQKDNQINYLEYW